MTKDARVIGDDIIDEPATGEGVVTSEEQMFDIALAQAEWVREALGTGAYVNGSDPLDALIKNLDFLFEKLQA